MAKKSRRWPDGKQKTRMAQPAAKVHALHHALFAQLGSLLVVLFIALALVRVARVEIAGILIALAMLQGGIAAMISYRQNAPGWWLLIHLGFAPLAVIVQGLQLAPGWYLAGFLLLLAIFWRTDQSRVPLYLSNRATSRAVLDLLPKAPGRIIDLGCGTGSLLSRLARARPDCRFVGIEHAPLPWLIARLRTLGLPNVTIRQGDFWPESLAGYDFVYAFLSPAPMSRLWEKACAEMPPGALLVSNSFDVPGVSALQEVHVGDRRGTRLHCYRPNKTSDFTAFPGIPPDPDQE
jgi:precorrin-6B methylase 2